jgi:cell division protein FtsL
VSALELHTPAIPSSPSLGRFRVIDQRRRPNVRRSRRRLAHPFRAALVYTSLPAFMLVVYVALWTAAVHGGYQEQHLNREIQRLRIENQTLQADVLRLRSPGRIYPLATKLGMQETQDVKFVYLSAPAPVAKS